MKKAASKKPYERVHHPQHYNQHPAGIEAIDVVEYFGFNIGSAMKYLWRAGLKPDEAFEHDFNKAVWYIKREVLKRNRELGLAKRPTKSRRKP